MDSPAKKFAKLTKARVSKFLGFSYHSLNLLKAACYMNQRFNAIERCWRRGRKTSEPGSDEETAELQQLIEDHGTVWNRLKRSMRGTRRPSEKGYLRHEAQSSKYEICLPKVSSCRTKALWRFDVITWCKTGTALPPSFGSICLYKTMTDKLDELGIEHTQLWDERPRVAFLLFFLGSTPDAAWAILLPVGKTISRATGSGLVSRISSQCFLRPWLYVGRLERDTHEFQRKVQG